MNFRNKTVAEFFAGIGLMRLGLEQAGWKVIWANDIDEDKYKMYKGHFSEDNALYSLDDVHRIDPKTVPSVGIATASFPCNDLSLAGGRKGLSGQNSSAFWGFINVIKGMDNRRPPIVLLENVSGFLTSNDGNDFRSACLALNNLGYSVDAFMIDASLFVPQSRVRLFLVGIKDKQKNTNVKENALSYECQSRPRSLADFIIWNPDIHWSIRHLPIIPNRKTHIEDILEDIPKHSKLWWSKPRAEYLLNQMSERHRLIAEKMILDKSISHGTIFRRVRHGRSMAELRVDGTAGCLRTPRGGSGRQILFSAGKGRYSVRLLSPRECARLMGADDFRISATLNQALFGFGDAVCVPVIHWIGAHYLNQVWKEIHAAKK